MCSQSYLSKSVQIKTFINISRKKINIFSYIRWIKLHINIYIEEIDSIGLFESLMGIFKAWLPTYYQT